MAWQLRNTVLRGSSPLSKVAYNKLKNKINKANYYDPADKLNITNKSNNEAIQ